MENECGINVKLLHCSVSTQFSSSRTSFRAAWRLEIDVAVTFLWSLTCENFLVLLTLEWWSSLKSSCIQFHISLSNVFHAGKLVQFPQKLCYIVSLVLKTSNPMADNTSQLSSQEHTNAIVEKFTRRFTQISSCQFDAIQFHRTFVMTLESETSEMQAFLTLDTENERVHFRSFRARQVAEIPLK